MEKKAPEKRKIARSGPISDPDFVQAVVAVFRELEPAGQLGAVLDRGMAWSGADFGVGFGAGGDRGALTPQASSAPAADARASAFAAVHPEQLRTWLPDGPQLFDGLGPFAAVARRWPAERPSCSLALPLLGTDGEWGGLVLLLLDKPPAAEIRDRLEHLLVLIRPAVDNLLRMLSLRELVIKDDTAHCFNRRYFEEFLPEELARANRFRSPVSLIFLDMDNLKQVNSRHGHAVGSQTLREVSLRVRSKIRKFDKLFRFGGDEFCIVLPETAWHGALEVAERVRDAIAGKPFLTREVNNGRGIRMSASLGIASFPLHARNQGELIERADRAMQKVKKGGKNAIGISGIEDGEGGR